MADGEVKIKTELDNTGLDKGLKDMKNKLDGAGKQADTAAKKSKGLTSNLKGLNAGALATAAGMAGVSVAVKKTVDALNDCAAAYKVQEKAENALQIAAKNNPYLNDESVYNLRNFASELQSISEIGDEVSLQVMAQLAAAGRNEEQIMQIMSAAADMAAVTGQDIASAAQQLNATLNGNAGTLGRQIDSINNLTDAELKSGKAIEIVGQQYRGMAASTADVGVQLNNAWGDFKENIGSGWDRVTKPVKQFFLDVLNDINTANAETKALKDAKNANSSGNGTSQTYKTEIDNVRKQIAEKRDLIAENEKLLKNEDELNKRIRESRGYFSKSQVQENIDAAKKQVFALQAQIDKLTPLYEAQKKVEKAQQDKNKADQKAAEIEKAAAQRDADAIDHINANKAALEQQLEAIRLQAAATGKAVDEQAIYNAYLNSYIDLIAKSKGLVSENNSAAKERLELLEKQAEKLKDITDAEKRKAEAEELSRRAEDVLSAYGSKSQFDEYLSKQAELLKLKEDIDRSEVLSAQKKAEKISQIEAAMAQNRRELWAAVSEDVNGYAQQVSNIIQEAANMALDTEKNRMRAELANLEILYRKGELSEEEYQKKVSEAKKKGARVQYQIEMAQWGANILTATANTAVGVTQAIAQGGIAGIITGAIVGAAGAVQLASIMAAKPQPPNFWQGGVIGGINGASMGGDNTYIHARNGEMVLNAMQQRGLWDMINGGNNLGGINLVVHNSASNLVSTNAQIDQNKIELMIDARINEGLKNGRYNAGLTAANASMSGDFYGI